MQPDSKILIELVQSKMPFGKYKGHFLYQIPEHYLLWMSGKGFPKGKLGQQMAVMLEIRVNGLEYLLKPIIEKFGTHS